MNPIENASPPKAPLVLRIGVTGHRPEPDDLPADKRKRAVPNLPAINQAITEILEVVRNTFRGVATTYGQLFDLDPEKQPQTGGGVLRIISALATGADQWVVEKAINPPFNFELQSILPFSREEYLQDFSGSQEKENFLSLLAHSTSTLEMDGKVDRNTSWNRQPDSRSYEAAGRAMLNQTDLLVAVWDGQDAHGKGGTGQVVREALQNGIPVVWIPWTSPEKWCLQNPSWRLLEEVADLKGDSKRLSDTVKKLLLPPEETPLPGMEAGESLREEYFNETRKTGNPQHGVWLFFRNLVCGELWKKENSLQKTIGLFRVKDFEDEEKRKSEAFWNFHSDGKPFKFPVNRDLQAWINERYLKHYAWANGLSIYYGNMHRSAFVLNYFLGALAVFLALVCMAAGIIGKVQTGWIIAELVVIVGILALTYRGRNKRWHQRWIDYRTLAEYLRLSRCLILQGGGSPQVVYGAHLKSYGNPAQTWMKWHYRAIERAAGIPGVKFTVDYLLSCQELWQNGLTEDQIGYHNGVYHRLEKMDKRLHRLGDGLFMATLAACLVHLTHIWLEGDFRFEWVHENISGWMTLLCAFLPALGAALAAIRSHGEMQRLALRSRAMEDNLKDLKLELAKLPVEGEMLNSEKLRFLTSRVSDLMTSEMLDWRVVFQDRPLGLPA